MKEKIRHYFWATYRRKHLDRLLAKNLKYFAGVVLDIGDRDRGGFIKPKEDVEKWIFADIVPEHKPDILLDVQNMEQIGSGSIDVICATKLFEHVENIEKGLEECRRVLKDVGILILSVPFMHPVHADPYDFQRWTEEKWQNIFRALRFKIEYFEIMGRYFTVVADMGKVFARSLPRPLRWVFFIFYPLFDLMVRMDGLESIRKHQSLGRYHSGYFFIQRKT